MGYTMQQQSVQTRITSENFHKISRGWVAMENGSDIFFEMSKHDLNPF